MKFSTYVLTNRLAFTAKLCQSTMSVGETRPMINSTQNSMRRLGRLEPSCTGRRAWFVDYL